MIDIDRMKQSALTPQEVYDICDFATQAANDNGFMNTYIFERALYIYGAIILYPEIKNDLAPLAAQNINDAWAWMLEDDFIDNMIAEHEADCDYIAEIGKQWFDDYVAYAHSARGVLEEVQKVTGGMLTNASEQFFNATTQSGIQEVLEIADNWGMNNDMEVDNETLFIEE